MEIFEETELHIRRVGGTLRATLRLNTEGGNEITYTIPVSPSNTLADIELMALQSAHKRLGSLLPKQSEADG